MYKDVFNDDPISDDELDLQYDFDPKHNYFADVDDLFPAWQVPVAKYLDSFPIDAALSDSNGPREVRTRETEVVVDGDGQPVLDGRGRPRRRSRTVAKVQPFRMYWRAIDPDGNICPLAVSTCRADRDKPSGDDGLGTAMRVATEKNRRGWLIVENVEGAWNPYSGKVGQDYCAWALAVMQLRRRLHAEYQRRETEQFLEEKKRQALELAKEQAQITGRIQGEAMVAAMDRAAEKHASRRPKAEAKEQ